MWEAPGSPSTPSRPAMNRRAPTASTMRAPAVVLAPAPASASSRRPRARPTRTRRPYEPGACRSSARTAPTARTADSGRASASSVIGSWVGRDPANREEQEDRDTPRRAEPVRGQHPSQVEQHDHQRELERHAEDDQDGGDERQVLRHLEERCDTVAAEAEQHVERRTQDEVGDGAAEHEQDQRRDQERRGPPPLVPVQAGCDEAPELAEPDRRREKDPGDEGDLSRMKNASVGWVKISWQPMPPVRRFPGRSQ